MPDHADAPPPVLLDAMLGRLARWMRFMGYDAAYLADTDDLAVVRQARAEGRVVLTRDRGLAARRGIQVRLIQSQQVEEQIEQVITLIGLPPEPRITRCGDCNTPLVPVEREAVRSRVPPYVWRTADTFTWCEQCRKVYWPGSHWERIEQHLPQTGEGSLRMLESR